MSKNVKLKTILTGEDSPLRRTFNKARNAAKKAAGRIAGYFRGAALGVKYAYKSIGNIKISKSGLLGAVGGMVAAGYAAVRLAAKYETQATSYKNLVGDAETAKKVLDELTTFSTVTPFEPDEVYAAGKTLLAFNHDAATLIPTLRAIGDIASGAGIPLNELAQIYGKVMTKGKAQTEELNQMAERGVPIIQALADMYGVTADKIYEMASRGEISFDAIKQAFDQMTSKGGKFHNMMKEQSETLEGVMSTLLGNVKAIGKAIGSEWLPELKEAAKWANSVAAAMNKARSDAKKSNVKINEGEAGNQGKLVGAMRFITDMVTFGHADDLDNFIKNRNGQSRSVIRADLSDSERRMFKRNRADKAANPDKTIPQIAREAAEKKAREKREETERRKQNSLKTAVNDIFGGPEQSGREKKRLEFIDKYVKKAEAAAKKLGKAFSPKTKKQAAARAAEIFDRTNKTPEPKKPAKPETPPDPKKPAKPETPPEPKKPAKPETPPEPKKPVEPDGPGDDAFMRRRLEFIDKYVKKAEAAAKKLKTDLSPEMRLNVEQRAGAIFDEKEKSKQDNKLARQLLAMKERLKIQKLLNARKNREAAIQKELAKAEKDAAEHGRKLTAGQIDAIRETAGKLFDEQKNGKQDKAAAGIAAKGNRDLSDRLSRIGVTIGGAGSNPGKLEQRENRKIQILEKIAENTEDDGDDGFSIS